MNCPLFKRPGVMCPEGSFTEAEVHEHRWQRLSADLILQEQRGSTLKHLSFEFLKAVRGFLMRGFFFSFMAIISDDLFFSCLKISLRRS